MIRKIEGSSDRTIHHLEIEKIQKQRLFRVGEAAQYLGMCDDTLREHADLGRIPVYRYPNNHRAFRLEDLNAFIDSLPSWDDACDATCAGQAREAS
jgi:excisionase family DNA binding protein